MAIAQKNFTQMHKSICGTICIEKVFVNCKFWVWGNSLSCLLLLKLGMLHNSPGNLWRFKPGGTTVDEFMRRDQRQHDRLPTIVPKHGSQI